LDEIIMGGMVLETRMTEILEAIFQQRKIENQENPVSAAKSDLKNIIGEFTNNLTSALPDRLHFESVN